MTEEFNHKSVLLDEAVEHLVHDEDGMYIDGTFGRGGHSGLILKHLSPTGKLQAFDKDPLAIAQAQVMSVQDPRLSIAQTSFANMDKVAQQNNCFGQVQGILLDLGVSSPQIDDASRGFSFQHDGPLDMRMNPDEGESAAQWLARASAEEIADVLYHYGEERFSRRMARWLRMADLQGEDLIVHSGHGRSAMHDAVTSLCREAGFEPVIRHEVAETSTLVTFVAAALGVAIVPEPVSALVVARTVYRPLASRARMDLVAATRADDGSALLRRALRVLEQSIGEESA